MEGIIIGTVTENWDKDHLGMLKVTYLLGEQGTMKTEWVPVMVPIGGSSYGGYHLPEVGNTVVLGLEAGNVNRPVVLGCIWSKKNPSSGDTANEKNSKCLWKSKSGYSFTVEDEENKVTWSDSEGKNSLEWDTKDKTLTVNVEETVVLKVDGEEFLKLQKGKVKVNGSLDFTTSENFSCQGENVTLKPKQKLQIKGNQTEIASSQSIVLKAAKLEADGTTAVWKGQQVKIEGTAVELNAQAIGKVSASGVLELKGAMIKLN